MRIVCSNNMIIDHYFVFVNNNWIVSPIVTLFKDIQNVFRYLTDIIKVFLSLQLRVTPGQRLFAPGIVDRNEPVGWFSGGRAVPVAAVSPDRDDVGLTVRDPGELGQTRSRLDADVRPVGQQGGVPPVGDGAPDGTPEEGGHGVQDGAQVHLET